MNTSFLNEHRCQCGKLLLKGIFFDGTLEIKCRRCGKINKIGTLKLTDDAKHYLLIINEQGILTNVSDSACKILEYSYEELKGKHFTLINPAMPTEINKKFLGPLSVLKDDNFFEFDTVHQSKSGKKIPVSIFIKLYQLTDKEKCGLLSVSLKNAKVAGDDKTFGKKPLNILDYGCDYYFSMDKNWIAESMSPSVETLFGFSPEAVIGSSYLDFLPEETKDKTKQTFASFSADCQPFRIVNVGGKDAQGKPVMSEQYFTPNFDDNGKFVGYRVLGWVIKEP